MKRGSIGSWLVSGVLLLMTGPLHATSWSLPQADVGEAIGLLCGRLIESVTRQPEELSFLESQYELALNDLREGRASIDAGAAVGLGLACGRLIESVARLPDAREMMEELYARACRAPIEALPRSPWASDIALGQAQVWDRYLEAIARQPDRTAELGSVKDACLLDIDGLRRPARR